MSIFSFFSRRPKNKRKGRASKPVAAQAFLKVEALEDRFMPSTTTISGYVFADANNNGIYDAGETAIANAPVQLRDASNNIIGSTTSDANGFYQFNQDATIGQNPITLTKTLTFPSTQTDYSLPGGIAQFDPSLGQLQSVEIIHDGSITSDIQVENTSTLSGSSITGTVSGSLELTGPGVDSSLTMTKNAGGFVASKFDGSLDYSGTSGTDFGAKTATGSQTIDLTGAAMSPYIGTGQVAFTENAHASSFAAGGGNLNASLNSSGKSTVTVIYKYVPNNSLKPGTYTVIQTVQPQGYTDGKISAGGVVLNHQPNVDVIPVTLDANNNSVHNDFGKLVPAGISGFVYADSNNNGIKDPGEAGIPGTTVTLTGTSDQGAITPQSMSTDANGYYQFTNLRPGTYTVQETQPANWLDGKDTAGSLGGTVTNDQIAAIALPSGGGSINNNFGELKPASLSGFVYVDANNNGIKDLGEAPIAGVTITLSGSDINGPVNQTATTDGNGFYQFKNLDPGNYQINETQPANYFNGKDAIGSQGGVQGNDVFSSINLAAGVDGVNNNFGELLPASISGYVYVDANNNGVKDGGETPIAGVAITLSGADASGPVSLSATTDANGFYQFQNLKPGVYAVNETQPANYLDGKDAIGSQGGVLGNDVLSAINLAAGVQGVNNNFGELTPAGLSGFVYVDSNNNGVKDAGESAIPGTTVTLTGFDDQGPLTKQAVTDANGFYQFQNLRPGTYALTETQPASFMDGKDTIGSQGGAVANDNFSNIALASGILGINNNFGELPPANSDLGIVKSASASSVLVGSTINYTLTVTNYGPSAAQNVKVVDVLPADAIYVNATGTGWTINRVGTTITSTLPNLAVGASTQIFVTIKAPAVADVLTNTGTVSSDTPDNNPNNNTSTVVTTVYNQPGTLFPKGIVPLAGAFGNLPIISKVQLFSVDPTPYIDPVVRGQMTFVMGAYETFLGRSPSTTELMAGYNQLQAGVPTTTLANNLWNSNEHRAQQASSLYQTFLGRVPSAAELSSAVFALQSGTSEISLSLSLVNSAEYLGSHPTPTTLVAGLYQDILNQVPDASTQLQAASALANESVSTLALSLMTSSAGLGTIVNDAYLEILRRPAGAGEIQNWVSQLQSNQTTLDQMQISLLTSGEFYQLASISIGSR